MVRFKTFLAEAEFTGYVFHGTPRKNLLSIKQHGLRPTDNPLNFHQDLAAAEYYGEGGVILRVKNTDLPKATTYDALTHRMWTYGSIPPDKLEIRDKRSLWQPLISK